MDRVILLFVGSTCGSGSALLTGPRTGGASVKLGCDKTYHRALDECSWDQLVAVAVLTVSGLWSLLPALLCGLAGDAEPGTDLGPGVTLRAQALDGLGYVGVDQLGQIWQRTRASTSPSPTRRQSARRTRRTNARNAWIADTIHWWAFCSVNASPGARAYYDEPHARGKSHSTALRQVGNRPEPTTSSLSGCRPRALELRVDSSGAVRMFPECSRLPVMVGCFWHGCGTP
jgi:hypothetical protein